LTTGGLTTLRVFTTPGTGSSFSPVNSAPAITLAHRIISKSLIFLLFSTFFIDPGALIPKRIQFFLVLVSLSCNIIFSFLEFSLGFISTGLSVLVQGGFEKMSRKWLKKASNNLNNLFKELDEHV